MAGFKNLEDLVGDLEAGLKKLRAGALEPEELSPLVVDARELYDRLTLLRFKAHEFSYEVRRKGPEGGVDANAADRQPVRPFRIGAAYQTSLIDAIEEVSREQAEQAEAERMAAGTPGLFDAPMPMEPEPEPKEKPTAEVPEVQVSITPEPIVEPEQPTVASDTVETESASAPRADVTAVEEVDSESAVVEEQTVAEPEAIQPAAPAPSAQEVQEETEAPASLAEQMERQPISSLRSAFSLVEKYECIKMLFADDAGEFNRALEALDDAGTYELALHWLDQHVEAFGTWDREDPVVMRFLDRIERRYH